MSEHTKVHYEASGAHTSSTMGFLDDQAPGRVLLPRSWLVYEKQNKVEENHERCFRELKDCLDIEHSGLPYAVINCPDVFQTDEGASENYLRSSFMTPLSQHRVSMLILDEIDMIASERASRKGVEAKLFATLLNLIDTINLDPDGHKIIIIDIPMDPIARPTILKKVARATHGFVPTDLQALCTESALQLITEMSSNSGTSDHPFTTMATIDFSYFERALKTIRPSGMGEYRTKIPTITFGELYGIQDSISDLRISIIEPFNNPQKYIDLGISPPRGVMVHGSPGVGKTML
ncbi:hypothetical protein BG004_003516, partial [Podila humilis]